MIDDVRPPMPRPTPVHPSKTLRWWWQWLLEALHGSRRQEAARVIRFYRHLAAATSDKTQPPS
jgi:hypothetical protein